MTESLPNQFHRAALPEILFLSDLATALSMTTSAARRALLRGECGPYFRIGRRYAVRREAFLQALEARERAPDNLPTPPAPKPPDWATKLLQAGRRRAGGHR